MNARAGTFSTTLFGVFVVINAVLIGFFWTIRWALASVTVSRIVNDRYSPPGNRDRGTIYTATVAYNLGLSITALSLFCKDAGPSWLRWGFMGLLFLNGVSLVHEIGRWSLPSDNKNTEKSESEAKSEVRSEGDDKTFRELLTKIFFQNELTEEQAKNFSSEISELQKSEKISLDEAILLKREIEVRNVSGLPTT